MILKMKKQFWSIQVKILWIFDSIFIFLYFYNFDLCISINELNSSSGNIPTILNISS